MGVPLPAGVRPPLAIPHGRGDEPLYGNVPYALGVARRRRLRSRAPQTATLQWRLPLAQLVLWDTWFEDTLQAGALAFDVPAQGRLATPGLETLEVRFAEPPRREITGAWAVISAEVVGAIAEGGSGGALLLAWHDDVSSSSSPATAGNSGAVGSYFPGFDLALNLYARVLGYTGQTMVWTGTWVPSGSGSGGAPVVTGLADGVVLASWPRGGPFSILHGMLTITATADGSPVGNALEAVTGPGTLYNAYAWQPAP